jgi:hypothetical protein
MLGACLGLVGMGTLETGNAQDLPAIMVEQEEPFLVGEVGVVFGVQQQPNQLAPEQAKKLLLMQMRGLIQNELSLVEETCKLEEKQKQALVDLAEEEWRVKTNVSVNKRTQQHIFGNVDLDSLAERVVRDWLTKAATPEQVELYDKELGDRMLYRKKALISKMLDVLEQKLHLSASQMEQIEIVISEKWRDRWYKSLEGTFDNVTLHPEIRPTWIASILSDSQRAALVTREAQVSFTSHHATPDAPSMELTQRFEMGALVSSPSIEIDKEPNKNPNKNVTRKVEKELETLRQNENAIPE